MAEQADPRFILRQRKQGDWMVYVEDRDGKTVTRGPILASNVALDTAIETWESLHDRKVPSEFSFSRVPYVESVRLG